VLRSCVLQHTGENIWESTSLAWLACSGLERRSRKTFLLFLESNLYRHTHTHTHTHTQSELTYNDLITSMAFHGRYFTIECK